MGGPSAALVLGELVELGVRRAVRVGTCVGIGERIALGELLVVGEAMAVGGSAVARGPTPARAWPPIPSCVPDSGSRSGIPRPAPASRRQPDTRPGGEAQGGAVAADMQTAPLLARARALGVSVAALLIVAESADGDPLGPEQLAELEKSAGRVAATALSP